MKSGTASLRNEIVRLLKRAESTAGGRQEESEQELRGMGPEAIAELMDLLRMAARKRRRACHIYWSLLALILLGIGAKLIVMTFWYSTYRKYEIYWIWTSFFILPSMVLWFATLHNPAARLLATVADKRAVGPLLQCWSLRDVRAIVEEPLLRLLPQLQEADAHLLTESDRDCLAAMTRARKLAVVLAALTALKRVGDGRAVAAVRVLAEGSGIARDSREVRLAAQNCLSILQARAEQDRHREILLRAASALHDRDSLLQPALNAGSDNSFALLRPHEHV